MKYLKFILAILIILMVVILAVENYEAFSTKVTFKIDLVSIHYQSAEISLYYIVAISFLFGVIITGLYSMIERFQLKRRIKVLSAEAKERDAELNSLRNLPITSNNMVSGQLNNNTTELLS